MRPTADDLDDEIPYHPDAGCHVAPKCLECPLPECIYVGREGRGNVPRFRVVRWQQVLALRAAGLSADAIALRLGVTRRTVYRALASYRAVMGREA